MELDELRARWQQALPPPDPPSDLNEAALRQLLTGRPGSPVARLERNAQLEFAFTGLASALSVAGLLLTSTNQVRARLLLLLLVCLVMLPYYVRKSQLIRRLRAAGGSVREHTRQQVRSLRALMRLNYWLTMSTLPLSVGISLFYSVHDTIPKLPPSKLTLGLSLLVACYLLIGGLLYLGVRRVTRWWLQKRYGQHLDRLEACLAELAEPATNFSD